MANLNSRIGLSRIKRILNSYPEIPVLEDIEIKLENEEIMVHDNNKWVSLKNVLGSIFIQFNKIILNFLRKQKYKKYWQICNYSSRTLSKYSKGFFERFYRK